MEGTRSIPGLGGFYLPWGNYWSPHLAPVLHNKKKLTHSSEDSAQSKKKKKDAAQDPSRQLREEFREGTIYKAMSKSKAPRQDGVASGYRGGSPFAQAWRGHRDGAVAGHTQRAAEEEAGPTAESAANRQKQLEKEGGDGAPSSEPTGAARRASKPRETAQAEEEPAVEMPSGPESRGVWGSTEKTSDMTERTLPSTSQALIYRESDQWVMLLGDNLTRKHGVQFKTRSSVLNPLLAGVHSVNGSAQSHTKGKRGLISPLKKTSAGVRLDGASQSLLFKAIKSCVHEVKEASSGGSWGWWQQPASRHAHRAGAVWPLASLSLEKCWRHLRQSLVEKSTCVLEHSK